MGKENSLKNAAAVFSMKCDTSEYVMKTPIGDIKVEVCSTGLHGVGQLIQKDVEFSPDVKQEVKVDFTNVKDIHIPHVRNVQTWFLTYFGNPTESNKIEKPSFCPGAFPGEFSTRIWCSLRDKVGPGETVSYGELAELASYSSRAHARAVGQAMATNPFQIIVPCHRVLPSSGVVGNYSRGKKNNVKVWLLQFEGVHVKN